MSSHNILNSKRIVTNVLIIILLIFLSACNDTVIKNPSIIAYPDTLTHPLPQNEYRINVGDELEIKFFYNPDLNENITVRPDGRITLQLVHDVMAAGLTSAELTTILTDRYSTEIKKPEIAVIVRSFSAQRVYIDGEVNTPGMLDLIKPLTVLQSISLAGGLKDTARTGEVIVIRRQTENKLQIIPVNLEMAINGTDLRQDVFLTPYDIVFVPKSPIANLNQWVDQYVHKIIPIRFGVGYSLD